MMSLFFLSLIFFLFLILKEDLFTLKISGEKLYILFGYTLAFFILQNPSLMIIFLTVVLSFGFNFISKKFFKLQDGDIFLAISLIQILIFNYTALLCFIALILFSLICFYIITNLEFKDEEIGNKLKIIIRKVENNDVKIPFTVIITYCFITVLLYAKIY